MSNKCIYQSVWSSVFDSMFIIDVIPATSSWSTIFGLVMASTRSTSANLGSSGAHIFQDCYDKGRVDEMDLHDATRLRHQRTTDDDQRPTTTFLDEVNVIAFAVSDY